MRNALSLKKLVYPDAERAVIEWLARLSDHIPDPWQHRTLFYGE